MKRLSSLLAILLATMSQPGCAEPKFGASNPRASLDRMKERLDPATAAQFQADVTTVADMQPAPSRSGAAGAAVPPWPTLTEVLRPLEGMTVGQIHAKAESIRTEATAARRKAE